MRDLTLTYARRRNSFGTQSFGMRSRFLDEIPAELTDAGSRPAPITSWAATTPGPPPAEAQIFRTGEDVVHPKFGEGVVTGLEPGGIVVVRFAGDGAERKLMADYAPIRRR
jgi:DNA helicase-2/ATP-dependent DNA helicase PcrA